MKKLAATVACVVTVIVANTMFAFADNDSANTFTSASQTVRSKTTSAQQAGTTTVQASKRTQLSSSATETAGIVPGSPLYVFDKLMESIQFTVTFPSEGKAELLISFANERLAEASILNDESKIELVEDIMKAYLEIVGKANDQIKEAAEEGSDVKPIIREIKLTEDSAQAITISIKGEVQPESADRLEKEVVNIVKETLAVEAFATAKANFFESKKQFELAKGEFKKAMKSKDEALIKAAREKLALAEKNKYEMELVKDLIEIRKEAVKDEIEIDSKELEEKNMDSEKAKDQIEKKIEKIEEKAEQKTEKAIEKAEKEEEKARERAKKIYEKSNDKDDDEDDDDDDKDDDDKDDDDKDDDED